jgi:hypothetical protein
MGQLIFIGARKYLVFDFHCSVLLGSAIAGSEVGEGGKVFGLWRILWRIVWRIVWRMKVLPRMEGGGCGG